MRNRIMMLVSTLGISLLPLAAMAHVVVKPAEVGVGAFQTFTTGVPTEKDNPTVGLRIVIPAGLKYVSPNVKPGWTIDEKKTGTGEDATVTEISWTGGQIPIDQRDEFLFSAQVPAQATTLKWKAYQTYADGTVVAWDQQPTGSDSDELTPYSTTKVINDLTATKSSSNGTEKVALYLSIAAVVLAAGALIRRR